MTSGKFRIHFGQTYPAFALLVILSTGGCSNERHSATGPQSSNDFRLRLISPPASCDWGAAYTSAERPVLQNIMRGLVDLDSSLHPVAALAERWTSTELKWTFRIRPGLKWSDGSPLQADDFVFAWKRLLDPLRAAPFSFLLAPIARTPSGEPDIFTEGSDTVGLRLRSPFSRLLPTLAHWSAFPMKRPPAGSECPPTLGPFQVTQWKPDTRIELSPNPRWISRGAELPKPLPRIRMEVVTSDETAANLFERGLLDYVPLQSPSEDLLRRFPSVRSAPALRTCFIVLNPARLPLSERKKMANARPAYRLKTILGARIEPARSLIPPSVLPDPEARKSAPPAGIPDGKALPFGSLLFQSGDLHRWVAEALSPSPLGLDLKSFRETLKSGAWAAALRCWNPDTPTPESFLELFLPDSPNAYVKWNSRAYAEAVARGLFHRALEIIQDEESLLIPLFHENQLWLQSNRFAPLTPDPSGRLRLEELVATPQS